MVSSARGPCMVPLAQPFLHAQALLDLGSCTSLAAAALLWPMCLLHQPSMPPTKATSAGCLYFLPLLPHPQHSWWLRWQGHWLVACPRVVHTPSTCPWLCLACILPCSHTSLAALSGMAASTTVPRQWHPYQGAGTELSPGPCWQGARLSLLSRPASAPGSTVTSLCFFFKE